MKTSNVVRPPWPVVLIGSCDGPFAAPTLRPHVGTKVPIARFRRQCPTGFGVKPDAPGQRQVGVTPVTVDQLIMILEADGGAAALFRRFPDLDPQDIRDAIDYAASNGLLDGVPCTRAPPS